MSDGVVVVAGGEVLLPSGAAPADVVCRDGRVAEIVAAGTGRRRAGGRVVDATGLRVVPGFIDLQVNGGWGIDLTSTPGRVHEVGARLAAHGVTAYLPTIVSAGSAARATVLHGAVDLTPPPDAAAPLGWHFEGPMLHPEHRGAHDPGALRPPSVALVAGWSPAAGVRMVTVAPELDGAIEVIRLLAGRGVIVAAGHTGAGADDMATARAAGLTYVTHLFNAMRPLRHRDPGIVGAVLGGDLTAGLIVDGVHVDPAVVTLAWRCLGPARTCLVSDAAAALDAPGPHAVLGGVPVTDAGGAARDATGRLAGSTLTLDAAIRNLVTFTGCDWADAVAAATAVPRRVLGDRERGVIAAGARADLVLLTPGLQVATTLVGGEIVG